MSDLISRQAAIDATSEIVFVEYEDTDPCKEEKIITQTKAAIRDRIKALPPVYVPDMNVGGMISRDAAMEMLMAQNVIMDGSEYHNGFNAGVNRAQEVIRNLPSVQPKRGKWVFKTVFPNDTSEFPMGYLVCSECGSKHPNKTPCNFCDNCGADMRGGLNG